MSNIRNVQEPKENISQKPFLINAGLLFAWIAGLVLIGSLSWYFTESVRNRILLNAVNRVLERSGDSRRLGEPISSNTIGTWFTMTEFSRRQNISVNSGERAYVFVFVAEGAFFSCLAVLGSDGRVVEFLPLDKHGERIIKRISPGIFAVYAHRIEGVI